MESLYKVIWWNDFEQEYTTSALNEQGVIYLLDVIGEEAIFSIEEM